MFAGCGIGPFAGGAPAAVRPFQPNEQATARHLPDGMADSATNCPKASRRLLPSCFRGRRDVPMDPLST